MYSDIRIQKECVDLILKYGWNSFEVSLLKDIPSSTIRTWACYAQLHGRTPAVAKRERRHLGPRVENRACNTTVKAILQTLVEDYPWLYLDEFQEQLHIRSGVRLALSTIYRVLTAELHWSIQIAEIAARERNEVDRANHQATLNEITEKPEQFVFVDETSKDGDVHLRKRIWQPVNGRSTISRYFTDHAQNSYTMIGAADINGFIVEGCELVRRKKGQNDADEEAGTVDADRFVEYVAQKLVPCLGNYYLGEPRSIVVMDNASIHIDIRVYNLITGAGALLIYQSAYSPDLDPIEFCFRQYKCYLRRYGKNYGGDHYLAHFYALSCVSKANMCNYYRKVGGIKNIPNDDVVSELNEDLLFAAAQCVVQNTLMLVR